MLKTFKVGDDVKLTATDYRFDPSLGEVKDFALRIEWMGKINNISMLKFVGFKEKHWEGFFTKLTNPCVFAPGDKVHYVGTGHKHLDPGKDYTVARVMRIGTDDKYLLSLVEELKADPNEIQNWYAEFTFKKSMNKQEKKDPFPFFSEKLLELCQNDLINEDTCINLSIVNSNVKSEENYTKNDLITVLRTLQENKVDADVLFNSTMTDALTVVYNGRDIMEELTDNACPSKPIYALIELSNAFDITVTIDNVSKIYIVGYNGIVYEEKDIGMPSVQAANS
jgi:hypothetical protein